MRKFSHNSAVRATYAYSSIDLDPATKQVTAFATTEMDGALLPYYEPTLRVSIDDGHGGPDFASSCRRPSASTVVCQFAANASAYLITADHGVRLMLEDPLRRRWLDPVAYEYVAGLDIFQEFEIEFVGQGPLHFIPDQSLVLGSTFVWSDWPPPSQRLTKRLFE